MINSTINIGLQGIRQGFAGIDDAARRIVKAGTGLDAANAPANPPVPAGAGDAASDGSDGDLITPILDLKLYQRSVEASIKVVKTADELLGTLLDIKS